MPTAVDTASEIARLTGELERSARRFKDIIEHNADAIIVVDSGGVIQFANGAATALFGTSYDALVGTHFGFPVVDGETTEVDLLVLGTPRVGEMRVVESEWDGAPARIASLRDVTERKQAEEHARRLIGERAARTAAEASAQTLRFLADSTTLLATSLDYATTLASLARLCVSRIADWVVVYAVDDAGGVERIAVEHCDATLAPLAHELQEIRIPVDGPHPVLDVLRTRAPKVVNDVSADTLATMSTNPREREVVGALGVSAFAIVPMVARDRAVGALALISSDPQRGFDDDDVSLAVDIAGRAALALDNARLYGEAQRANAAKTELLSVVSHDLRTPLNAIIGYSDLLEMGIPTPISDDGLQKVKRIRTSAAHLLYLLDELLSFARLDAGAEQIHRSSVDVRNVVGDVRTMMERLAVERGLELRFVMPDSPVRIQTDPDKLRQVLLNLAGNGVRYTPTGSVTVELIPRDREIEVVVRDTGVGIAPEHLSQIFEPFWQVDRTQRARGGGTGLGLSVVHRVVALLGGTVRVQSEVGSGSVFTVTLPIESATAAP